MKIKKITTKLLVGIVPSVIIAMLLVATICVELAKVKLNAEIDEKLETKIEAVDAQIKDKMNSVEYATQGLGRSIGSSIVLLSTGITAYTTLLETYMTESEYIVAIGIFMEPTYWKQDLINYYVYEDGGDILHADLSATDLTENDWYQSVKSTGKGYYTETYVDTTIGILMTSYVVPMYDAYGNFIGALNVDINMSVVQDYVDSIEIGKTGRAQLVSNTGYYLSGVEAEEILSDEHMLTLEDDEYYDISESILSGEYAENTVGGKRIYSQAVEGYDWIVVMSIDESELNEACNQMRMSAAAVAFIALIATILIIYLIAKGIAKPITGIKEMSELMAQGDFSFDPIAVKSADEVGNMSSALNQMLTANRSEMLEISSNSATVGNNCAELKNAVSDLEQSVDVINTSIRGINEAMMDNSATAEELSASVQEVKAAVGDLTSRAKDSSDMAHDIMNRATKIGEKTSASFERAMELTNQYEQKLTISIQNSKVVEDIQKMAEAINEIADQINLLSLNASIEAARAGEAGRGFAVVAGEIGGLANQTASTVSEIQTTIEKVRQSVDTLAKDSHSVIEFINRDITPDYKAFVETAEQYQQDATNIQELATFVANIASNLNDTMEDVNIAIQNIADASQNAAGESSVIIDSVDVVSEHVGNVGRISDEQKNVADTLDTVVKRYKL